MKPLLDEATVKAFKSGNCFDFIRYFFALSLFIVHYCTLCGIDQFWMVSGGTRVKAFFTLSGFLVFYSLASKRDLRGYAEKRVRRIMPAYTAAIMLCLLTGILFGTLPTAEFLTSSQTWKYLAANLSFLNFLQPTLPGVFQHNPIPAMNGALWSMKVEIIFYLTAPVVYTLMTRFNRHLVLAVVYLGCLGASLYADSLYAATGQDRYLHLRIQIGSFTYFYAGVAILLYFRYFLPYKRYIIPLAALLFLGRAWAEPFRWIEALSFAALLVGFAYSVRPLNVLRRYDNISYGIYLYHFPVIQCFVQNGMAYNRPALTFALSLTITLILATLSWFLLEKPLLHPSRSVSKRT